VSRDAIETSERALGVAQNTVKRKLMTLNIDLIISEHINLSFLKFDHVYSFPVKRSIVVPTIGESVDLPLGLDIKLVTDGTNLDLVLEEGHIIELLTEAIEVGGAKSINLEPAPGFHIVGNVGLVA